MPPIHEKVINCTDNKRNMLQTFIVVAVLRHTLSIIYQIVR